MAHSPVAGDRPGPEENEAAQASVWCSHRVVHSVTLSSYRQARMHRPPKKTLAPCEQNANPEDTRRAHHLAITERIARAATSPESTETGPRSRGPDEMQEPKGRTQVALPQGQCPSPEVAPRTAVLREGCGLDSGRGAARGSAPTPMAARPWGTPAAGRGAQLGHVPPRTISQSTAGRTRRGRTKTAASSGQKSAACSLQAQQETPRS